MTPEKRLPDPIKPIVWAQAVRPALMRRNLNRPEQLAFEGMPEPPRRAAFRALLGWIWTYADAKTGRGIRPGLETVAEVIGADRATAYRAVKTAVEFGFLVKTKGSNRSAPAEYALALPDYLVVGVSDTHELSTGNLVVGTQNPVVGNRHTHEQSSQNLVVGTQNLVVGVDPSRSRREPHTIRGSVDQGGTQPTQSRSDNQDPTHGKNHPPGNPDDKPCRACGEERRARDNQPTPIPDHYTAPTRQQPDPPSAAYLNATKAIKARTA